MRPIASGALILSLLAAPSAAAQGSPRPPALTERPGRVEPAPVLTSSVTMQLRNDLTILRAALESYRAGHFYRYPEAATIEALIETLVHTDDLPEGFSIAGTVTECVANRHGYRISAQITVRGNVAAMTIRPPERFDPLWAMLMYPL